MKHKLLININILLIAVAGMYMKFTKDDQQQLQRSPDIKKTAGQFPGNVDVSFEEDSTSLLRNPAMGWGLYDDANDNVANADQYWKLQDEVARKYASFFYIRWRWSDMEPTEGHYAWLYDNNFKKLIKGAKDRGLKLAFRVYDSGKDNIQPGTPAYVKAAGAEGFEIAGSKGRMNWTPYADDPVFQQKYTRFIQAFAKAFDDPEVVDFVDGYNLGFWGEGHHISFKNPEKKEATFKWLIGVYSSNFKKVLLALTLGGDVDFDTEKSYAYIANGYIPRRDGVGSKWFSNKQKAQLSSLFPARPFIAESCYWGGSPGSKPWEKENDPKYPPGATWADAYKITCNEAIECHANTLDLREVNEAKGWATLAPACVNDFVKNGGYRFYVKLSVPEKIIAGKEFKILHTWKNGGVGMFPNNNIRWNYKYKVAFALISKVTGKPVEMQIDNNAEPSKWIKGQNYPYTFKGNFHTSDPSNYALAMAIVDSSKNNTPAIILALKNVAIRNGWTIIY